MTQSSLYRKFFGDRAFYKRVLAVAIPIMIQNGITQFVSLLDNIMVGSVNSVQMTGVTISNQLIFVFSLAIFGAISGAGIFGAQFFGHDDEDGVRYAFRFKLLICGVLLIAGVGIFIGYGEELIGLYLKSEEGTVDPKASLMYGRTYLNIMLIGLLPYVVAQCYAGTLRECGQTVVPMVAGIISVFVNLCLNGVLIFGLFGVRALGSAGAAIATVVARFVEATVIIVWTHKNKQKAYYMVGAYRSLYIPRQLFGQLVKKSVPLLINETCWAGGMALLAQCYSLESRDVVAAHNISSTVTNVFNIAFLAMGTAIGIIVGQLLGANKLEEAKDTDRKLITFSVAICFVIGGVMACFSPLFPLLYNVSDDIRDLATKFLLISAAAMPINSLANACYFTMRSGGKTLVTFLFDSLYVCALVVPMAYLLQGYTAITIVPLFLICQFADIGKCIVGLILIKKGVWIQNIVKE